MFKKGMSPNREMSIADLHAIRVFRYTSPKLLLSHVIGTAFALHEVYHTAGLAVHKVRGFENFSIREAKRLFFPYQWAMRAMPTWEKNSSGTMF